VIAVLMGDEYRLDLFRARAVLRQAFLQLHETEPAVNQDAGGFGTDESGVATAPAAKQTKKQHVEEPRENALVSGEFERSITPECRGIN
jgi:hypothetical protein